MSVTRRLFVIATNEAVHSELLLRLVISRKRRLVGHD